MIKGHEGFVFTAASVPEEVGQPVSGVLDQRQQARYQFPIPEQGITVRLCVQSGQIVFYASTFVPNPSNVLNEYGMDCVDCGSCELFVGPPDIPGIVTEEPIARRRRQAAGNGTSEGVTLYISMEGVQERSSFELQTDVGDTTGETAIR